MKKYIVNRTTRYLLLMLFLALSMHLIYQYIVSASTEIDAKTGTFVEAITPGYKISYIPYTQIGQETRMYQSMFFDSCLDYYFEGDQAKYKTNLCNITTKDSKNYIVRMERNARRSDGSAVTLDDVYETFQKILIENKRKIPSLSSYGDIAIEKRAEDLVVTFPESSADNRVFFTNFILPKRARDGELDTYVTLASTQNIGSGCAKIRPDTKDGASVVFDVSTCQNTKINNYQLKYISQEDTVGNYSYIDMVKGKEILSGGFVNKKIPTREFAFLFFNTKSKKLNAKIQNTLGGYINETFAKDPSYNNYLIKNRLVFDSFKEKGENLANYITAKNTNLPLDKYDLESFNVKALPTNIAINKNDKPTYFLESINEAKTLKIKVTQPYSEITIQHNKGSSKKSKTYNKATKTFAYTLSPKNGNLVEGLNEYSITGKVNGKKATIAELDIYYLTPPLQNKKEINDADKIHIMYIYHPTMDYIVERLQKIFKEKDIEQYFLFEGYDDIDKFKGKLLSQDYDIVLRMVSVGQRNDFRSIFASKDPVLNPSLYSDKKFILALEEYAADTKNSKNRNSVNLIYEKNTPIVVLGEMFVNYAIKESISTQITKNAFAHFYDFYRSIYGNISLGKRLFVQREDIFNKENLKEFIKTGEIANTETGNAQTETSL